MTVDRELRIVGGVAVESHRPPDDTVVAVLRAGVEDVVRPLAGIDLLWGTSASTAADDLGRGGSRTGRRGLAWPFVARKAQEGPLEGAAFGAQSQAMKEAFDANPDFDLYDPTMDVTDVGATFPTSVPYRDEPVGGVTAIVEMSVWALQGGGEDVGPAGETLASWVLEAATALDADCGFVAFGYLRGALPGGSSPYETWAGLHRADRDLTRYAWGYGWGTLLSSWHVQAVGGRARLEEVGTVRDVGGGRVWVTLAPDPAGAGIATLARLRQVLTPVLPARAIDVPPDPPEAHGAGPDAYAPTW